MHKKGLTLLEILIAAVIFSLVIMGLASVFLAGKRHLRHSRGRIVASGMGQYVLDPLQMQVRQDQWSANCLGEGINCSGIEGSWSIDNMPYTTATAWTKIAGTGLRKITTRVNWTEPLD